MVSMSALKPAAAGLGDAGVRVKPTRPQYPQSAARSASRCLAFAASPDRSSNQQAARVVSGAAVQQQPAAQEKYDRILAFVDAHATPIVLSSASSVISSACEQQLTQPQQQQLEGVTSSWHHSYDEEAEEGEELHEPAVLAFAASVPAAVAESAAAAATALATSPSWSYGNPSHPKPFFYAWDEEAEGAFELEPCCSSSSAACLPAAAAVPADPVAAAAALRAQRRAALHEARHAARASRRMRRSQLHPQLGDLEHMPAWVQPAGEAQQQQQRSNSGQRSAAGTKYAQLLALVAGDAATGQYRKPRSWHLTFDEDVHGPDAPETVLGSC